MVPDTLVNALGSPTLLCILGSRMFFKLKEAAEHGVNAGTNWGSHTHSSIQFNVPPRTRSGEEEGCVSLALTL